MNIYVGYLPNEITEQGLTEKFSEFGKVSSAKIIKDHETGRSRGFGFIEMKDDYEANLAIDGLRDWTNTQGKRVVVNQARERTERSNFRF